MKPESLYLNIPVSITDLSGWLAPFRGKNTSAPDVMSRPRMVYLPSEKIASDLFRRKIFKNPISVQALALELIWDFFSAACKLNLCDTFTPAQRSSSFIKGTNWLTDNPIFITTKL